MVVPCCDNDEIADEVGLVTVRAEGTLRENHGGGHDHLQYTETRKFFSFPPRLPVTTKAVPCCVGYLVEGITLHAL